jgi:quercetin dioxygenase-like cupin family protein
MMNMQEEPLTTNPTFNERETIPYSPFLVLDLPFLMHQLKQCNTSSDGEYSSMTLLKQPEKEVVLTAFREGTKLNSYQSNNSMTFQIIEGKLMLHTRKKSVMLEKGQFLALHDNIKYSLITDEETVFLITISNGDDQNIQNKSHRYS